MLTTLAQAAQLLELAGVNGAVIELRKERERLAALTETELPLDMSVDAEIMDLFDIPVYLLNSGGF